ncbi:MAG: hypothetical protein KAH44_31260, partial [Oricola sp.]|nr:hypothetical protein [Oricola sp.]
EQLKEWAEKVAADQREKKAVEQFAIFLNNGTPTGAAVFAPSGSGLAASIQVVVWDSNKSTLANEINHLATSYKDPGAWAQGAMNALVMSTVAAAAPKGIMPNSKGFNSFPAWKRYLGPAGKGNHWHHIVEQTAGNVRTFGSAAIHNTNNVVKVPSRMHVGKGSVSAYYSSIQPFTNGQTVRQWLSNQPLSAQKEFGL